MTSEANAKLRNARAALFLALAQLLLRLKPSKARAELARLLESMKGSLEDVCQAEAPAPATPAPPAVAAPPALPNGRRFFSKRPRQ
jgi:hypothetical protein